jgi:hypothetical protein
VLERVLRWLLRLAIVSMKLAIVSEAGQPSTDLSIALG